jgi:hypothetical protein
LLRTRARRSRAAELRVARARARAPLLRLRFWACAGAQH